MKIKRMKENEARGELAFAGVGETTIRELVKGTYGKRPGPLLRAALERFLSPKAS